ncbi:flagellar hook-basal body complex protein FliE [Limibaculum sp. M0105]|uniref:Flagellar hook-basal body complex protein FliE n=1 Tax=Thermohalobaculum xanthum TaxID=2753746 RepID=A0A8J7M4J7_9RHOB|nr:flagellar hook-basal body complex protein FliE [Thermohalobaculum xanthum]MBK0398110.1 flagellar hook-basal body complex protein FliE [Thermohalobaculum xanthum]
MKADASIATQLYGNSRKITLDNTPGPGVQGGLSFSDALTEAARMMEQSLRQGESAATATVSGSGDVQTLVEALSAAEMALETAVTVRDRVVEAYQEILRMPV